MNKNIILGLVAFGGLILVSSLVFDKPAQDSSAVEETSNETTEVKIPSDIPAFPIYPGVEVLRVSDSEGETSRDISLSLNVLATKNEIHDWYREELKKNGWHIKSDKNVAGYQIIQGENDGSNLYTSLQVVNGEKEGFVVISQSLKIRK